MTPKEILGRKLSYWCVIIFLIPIMMLGWLVILMALSGELYVQELTKIILITIGGTFFIIGSIVLLKKVYAGTYNMNAFYELGN